jgi:hypothetical protein
MLEKPPVESRNRVAFNFRTAFNVDVEFKNVGAFPSAAGTRLTPDGDPFNYDDGYVLVDSSGNALGYTRYWGYDNASQLPGDNTIVMHETSSEGASESSESGPEFGVELSYSRELGRGEKWRWGVEAVFGYMNVSVQDSGSSSLGVSRLSVPYQLPMLPGGGYVTPPPAPYYHGADLSPEGNPVIVATPLGSSVEAMQAATTGTRSFEANILSLRLGPYLEFPLNERWSLAFGGGLAVAQVNSDFSFTEAVDLPGVPVASGSGSNGDLVLGGYASATVFCKLNEVWALFGGAQFQSMEDYTHSENGREAVLNMGQSVFVTVGASFSF